MELSLAEKLILLSVDNKGWFKGNGTQVTMNLTAVYLFQLLESGNLRLAEGKVIVDNSRHPDGNMSDLLTMISNSSKPRLIKYWIGKFTKPVKIMRNEILQEMIRKKILKKGYFKLLWLFPLKIYPLVAIKEKTELAGKLGKTILYGNQEEPEMNFLGSLIMANHWEKVVFPDREQRKKATKLRKQWVEKYPVAKAVMQIIQSQHATAVVVTS